MAQENVDSLLSVWNDVSQADTNRLKAINLIAHPMCYSQPDSAYILSQLQYDFAASSGNKKWMAIALRTQGVSFFVKGEYEKAKEYNNLSLKIAEEIGDNKEKANIYNNLAILYSVLGDFDQAEIYFTNSYNTYQELGDRDKMANCLINIGNVHSSQGDFTTAMQYLLKGMSIKEEVGDKPGMASAYINIGNVYKQQSDFNNALMYQMKSLKIMEEIGDKDGIATSISNIGSIQYLRGNGGRAIEHFVKSLKIWEEIGNKSGVAISLSNIGEVYWEQHEYEKALEYYEEGLKIAEEIGHKDVLITILHGIGLVKWKQNNYSLANQYFNKSLKISEEVGDKMGISIVLSSIGTISNEQGDYEKALEYYNNSLNISEEIGNKSGTAQSLNNIGVLYKLQKQYAKAISYSTRSLTIAKEIGVVVVAKDAANTLYQCYKAIDNQRQSLEMYELFVRMRDSLQSEENQKKIIQYEYEKQALADKLVYEKKELIKDLELIKSENIKWFFVVVSCLTLLLAGFIFYGFKQKQRVNKYLKERNKFEIENKKRAIALFGQQVSKEVALELLSDTFKTGSKKIFACIMFLDIREFTLFAQNKEPSEIIQYQNDVFGFMIDTVSKHHGIINQFMGDGFMATFGAPASSGNDCQNAVNASLEIVALLSEKCDLGEMPLTKIGIGLHAGNIVTGNVGTAERKQYSITGNTVILASRIEQLNKKYKSEILISMEVFESLDQKNIKMEKLGSNKVKGRDEPIEIVRLI